VCTWVDQNRVSVFYRAIFGLLLLHPHLGRPSHRGCKTLRLRQQYRLLSIVRCHRERLLLSQCTSPLTDRCRNGIQIPVNMQRHPPSCRRRVLCSHRILLVHLAKAAVPLLRHYPAQQVKPSLAAVQLRQGGGRSQRRTLTWWRDSKRSVPMPTLRSYTGVWSRLDKGEFAQ
jgi:hypothetical protein